MFRLPLFIIILFMTPGRPFALFSFSVLFFFIARTKSTHVYHIRPPQLSKQNYCVFVIAVKRAARDVIKCETRVLYFIYVTRGNSNFVLHKRVPSGKKKVWAYNITFRTKLALSYAYVRAPDGFNRVDYGKWRFHRRRNATIFGPIKLFSDTPFRCRGTRLVFYSLQNRFNPLLFEIVKIYRVEKIVTFNIVKCI